MDPDTQPVVSTANTKALDAQLDDFINANPPQPLPPPPPPPFEESEISSISDRESEISSNEGEPPSQISEVATIDPETKVLTEDQHPPLPQSSVPPNTTKQLHLVPTKPTIEVATQASAQSSGSPPISGQPESSVPPPTTVDPKIQKLIETFEKAEKDNVYLTGIFNKEKTPKTAKDVVDKRIQFLQDAENVLNAIDKTKDEKLFNKYSAIVETRKDSLEKAKVNEKDAIAKAEAKLASSHPQAVSLAPAEQSRPTVPPPKKSETVIVQSPTTVGPGVPLKVSDKSQLSILPENIKVAKENFIISLNEAAKFLYNPEKIDDLNAFEKKMMDTQTKFDIYSSSVQNEFNKGQHAEDDEDDPISVEQQVVRNYRSKINTIFRGIIIAKKTLSSTPPTSSSSPGDGKTKVQAPITSPVLVPPPVDVQKDKELKQWKDALDKPTIEKFKDIPFLSGISSVILKHIKLSNLSDERILNYVVNLDPLSAKTIGDKIESFFPTNKNDPKWNEIIGLTLESVKTGLSGNIKTVNVDGADYPIVNYISPMSLPVLAQNLSDDDTKMVITALRINGATIRILDLEILNLMIAGFISQHSGTPLTDEEANYAVKVAKKTIKKTAYCAENRTVGKILFEKLHPQGLMSQRHPIEETMNRYRESALSSHAEIEEMRSPLAIERDCPVNFEKYASSYQSRDKILALPDNFARIITGVVENSPDSLDLIQAYNTYLSSKSPASYDKLINLYRLHMGRNIMATGL